MARDLAQEIDDLSTQQAAVINAIREFSDRVREGDYSPQRGDILASYILDAFDKATDSLNEVQAEIVEPAEAGHARSRCACGKGTCCPACCSVCRNRVTPERRADVLAEVERAGRSAFREAGITGRVYTGDTSAPLEATHERILMTTAEAAAFGAYRNAVALYDGRAVESAAAALFCAVEQFVRP